MRLLNRQLGRLDSSRRCIGGQRRCVAEQRTIFDQKVNELKKPLPDEVLQKLRKIVHSALMSPEDRVLDVGTGVPSCAAAR